MALRSITTGMVFLIAVLWCLSAEAAQPSVASFLERLDSAYQMRSAIKYDVMLDCPVADIQPFLNNGPDDALKNYRGEIHGLRGTVLAHSALGVLLDQTDPIQRKTKRGFEGIIYASGLIVTIAGEATSIALRQEVGDSASTMMSSTIAPCNLAANVHWYAQQDPNAAVTEPVNGEITLRLTNHGSQYEFVFDAQDLTLLRSQDQSKSLLCKTVYSGFVATDAMAAKFPRIVHRTAIRTLKSDDAGLTFVIVLGTPVLQESVSPSDFQWQSYVKRSRDSVTGVIYGPDDKPIEDQPVPVKQKVDSSQAMKIDPAALEKHKIDPTVELLPVRRSGWSRGLLALGISCFVVAGVWWFRNRSAA